MATGVATVTIRAKLRDMGPSGALETSYSMSNMGEMELRRITLASQTSTILSFQPGVLAIYINCISANLVSKKEL